jgi:predicted nucleic acid-binding protein
MILVDTSVWVGHLREGNDHLSVLLEEGLVLVHAFVIGELACGSMANRREILALLEALPGAVTAGHTEVLRLLEEKRLYGKGVGWIDAHLLASTMLSHAFLWTSDRRLLRVAESLGIAYRPGRQT